MQTDPETLALRDMKRRLQALNATVREDLLSFQHTNPALGFVRLPTSSHAPEVNVATTCTALMALATTKHLQRCIEGDELTALLQEILNAPWQSSKLPCDNAFTAVMILRTFGVVGDHHALSPAALRTMARNERESTEPDSKQTFKWKNSTVESIASDIANDIPRGLQVLGYPPSAAIAYWFVDAVANLELDLGNAWKEIKTWATQEFGRQVSRTVAGHDATMDPVAMMMAACLIARLHRHIPAKQHGSGWSEMPSDVELSTAIRLGFERQGLSGIWPKYFPLFHYPEAGSNYCFSFEMLEAVALEFPELVTQQKDGFLSGIGRATGWCEANHLAYEHGGRNFNGWNSGGLLTTFGKPESWATGVVHMFVAAVTRAVDETLHRAVVKRYHGDISSIKSDRGWKRFIDSDILLQGDQTRTSLKHLIETKLLGPIEQEKPLENIRRAALLFGPPGTSKTSLVKAIARRLGWPYVEITPTDFLSDGLEFIHTRSVQIFDDLSELRHAVVLFDEMDAFSQRRPDSPEEEKLDLASQFLTTSMLPKLAKLHDAGHILYFMATNHKRTFDPAIIRPGRFDMLLCLGPPSWEKKLEHLGEFLPELQADEVDKIRTRLGAIAGHEEVGQLNLYLFGEFKSFLEFLERQQGGGTVLEVLTRLDKKSFGTLVNQYTAGTTLAPKTKPREEYDIDKDASKLQ